VELSNRTLRSRMTTVVQPGVQSGNWSPNWPPSWQIKSNLALHTWIGCVSHRCMTSRVYSSPVGLGPIKIMNAGAATRVSTSESYLASAGPRIISKSWPAHHNIMYWVFVSGTWTFKDLAYGTLLFPYMSQIDRHLSNIIIICQSLGTISFGSTFTHCFPKQDFREYRLVYARRRWWALGPSMRVYRTDGCTPPS
jgi:hypothetical protein